MTRSIVITGASKGIGRAAAEGLAAAGWEVIGIARHTPTNFPGQFVPTDLSDPQGTAELSVVTALASATMLELRNTSDLIASISRTFSNIECRVGAPTHPIPQLAKLD